MIRLLETLLKMVELTNVCFVVVTAIAVITQIMIPAIRGPMARLQPDLALWLEEQSLEKYAGLFFDAGNYDRIF